MRGARWVGAGLAVAATGAFCWAVGMTVLQPLTEPLGPWPEAFAGNNTYWARDLRFMMVVVVVLGLVLAARGERSRTGRAVALGVLWIGADVVLDRADVAGSVATILLATVGVAGVLAAAVPWWADPVRLDRRVLVVAASVGAALVPLAAGIESPTGTEPELAPAASVTALLLLAVTVCCAVGAAPARSVLRLRVAGALVCVGVVVLRLLALGGRFPVMMVLGAVLLVGVALVVGDGPRLVVGDRGSSPTRGRSAGRSGRLRVVGLGTVVLIGYPVLVLCAQAATTLVLPVAPAFTALAGNIAVGAAGQDVLYALVGLLPGLLLGVLLAGAVSRGPASSASAAELACRSPQQDD